MVYVISIVNALLWKSTFWILTELIVIVGSFKNSDK